MDINCNIEVKQAFPFFPTLFGIYIDKLKNCLEEGGCVGTILDEIVIILLLMLMILFLWKGILLISIRN